MMKTTRLITTAFVLLYAAVFALAQAVAATDASPDPYFASHGAWGQDFADQWALHDLGINPLESASLKPVTVAVIDTGLDYLHPDFTADSVWRNTLETIDGKDDDRNGFVDDVAGWNFVDGDNNPWDQSGHGTHISGIIAAATNNGIGIAGINPAARIMPLKVANFAGDARSSSVAAAIYYAADSGARIINLSLAGFSISQIERDAAEYAMKKGVLIVAAAGNRATDTGGFGYGSIPGVLTVVATDRDNKRTLFSNFGVDAQIAAPGVDILSLRARDTDFILLTQPEHYLQGDAIVGADRMLYRASGTSFATAIVSGVASRLFSEMPGLTADQVKRMLLQSATDLDVPGVDQLTGYGLINPAAASSWPRDKYLEARIHDVSVKLSDASEVVISISGDAAADQFAGGQIEVAPSDSENWTTLGEPLTTPISSGVLLEYKLADFLKIFPGTYQWMLRLVSTHADGSARESRFALELPELKPRQTEAEDSE